MPRRTTDNPDTTLTSPLRGGGPAERRPYLVVLSGPHLGELHPLEPGRELTLGRREGADIRIHDEGVSRAHAGIQVEGDGAQVRDLGSQNGTYVDGARVTQARLRDGGRFHVGASTVLKLAFLDEVEVDCQRRLAQGAVHEPLTGVYNRRHLLERLAAELASAHRHQRAIALLLVDLDHLQALNDRLGYPAGDELLKMVAYVLQGAVRKEDVLARHGSDAFAILARETGPTGARALAERVRRAVERSRCGWQEHELAVTVSVGAAVVSALEHHVPGETERALIAAAERALLQAKQNGRNGCFTAAAIGAPPSP